MLTVLPKWRVSIIFNLKETVVFFVSDHHLSNVLQKVAGIEFDKPIIRLEITPEAPATQTGLTTGVTSHTNPLYQA